MTDVNYYNAQPQAAQASGDRGFGVTNWIGAGCSLALVAGLVAWGVQLTLRDVTEVPVIAALEGPMRVAPENPGGLQAAYQGLAVNEIKAGGAAAPAPERIVLAPPPVALEEPVNVVALSASAPTDAVTPETSEPETLEEGYSSLDVGNLRAQLGDDSDPLQAPAVTSVETAALAIIPSNVPGVVRSDRPLPRPAVFEPAAAPASDVQSASVDAEPASVPIGSRLVQLGAFDTPELATSEWDRLQDRFGDYMEGKQRLVQKATSGGRSFYRLRVVGFDDANDARRFCSAFLARNTACIPVTAK